MRTLRIFTTLLFLGSTLLTSGLNGAEPGNRMPSLAKPSVSSTGNFDGNRVRDDLENNGMVVSHRITGHSGMEWPKDNFTYTVFASGVWLAGKVNGDIRTATAEYGPELVPGPFGSDQNSGAYKLYKVSKADLADPLANDDFQNWPVGDGAPWVDEDGDGVYTPLPLGPDHPDFIGDQVIWYVANDGDPVGHSIFGTLPLGVEVQTTIFGFDRPDVFGDMMFVKQLIINKGENTIEDMFMGLWSDPDLGDAGDDFVGCDTTLGMGICYNDGIDQDFAGYSGGTPAVGYDFFQGPMVPSPGDTALAYGRRIPGFKNLEMTSFVKYINVQNDPVWSDPNDAVEVYNLMQGFMKDGTPYDVSITGGSRFVHPGDPTKNVDANDSEYVDSDIHASGDRRFLMNAGPFTMAPGDSQEVVFGIFMAAAGGPLDSYLYLKQVDELAQLAYDIQFSLPASPPAPEVNITTLPDEIILTWDDAAEGYSVTDVIDKLPVPVAYDTTFGTSYVTDPSGAYAILDTLFTTEDDTLYLVQTVEAIDTTFGGENTTFNFEGYNVYQLETASGTGASKLIATYDLVNGIKEIYDDVFDASFGETINRRVQFGTDSGIKRYIHITNDALNNGAPLKTNREYYFAVTAYGYNPYGIPKTLESNPQVLAIRPQVPTVWASTDSSAVFGSDISWTHSEGNSDGNLELTVIDPTALTGDEYEVYFDWQHYYLDVDGVWKTTNYPDSVGKIMLGKIVDCSGSTITAAAIVSADVGTVDLTFTFDMDCGDNWVDGIKVDLPDDLTINSWGTVGDCSYPQYGQNCVNMDGTLDAATNSITWGDSARTTFGMIEGGTVFTVNIAPPAGYPFSIDWQVWDDGYDGTIVDAIGTTTVTELGYEFKSLLEWNVKNASTGDVLVQHQTMQSGHFDDAIVDGKFVEGHDLLGAGANPIVDGVQVAVNGAPADLKWIGVTANADGPLASPVDALAWWYFPSYLIAGGDYTNQQVTTDATWFFNVGPMYGVDEDALMDYVFMYTGGYGAPGGSGVQWLVPDDFEIRFTGNGKAIDYWGTGGLVDVPFEWWNIGDASDPSDDFQLIPYLLDEDGNGIWNLQYGYDEADHGTSGGSNDPWTDRVYVLSPVDETPGSQGYDNFIAGVSAGSALPPWYAQPGDNDPGGPMDAWLAFARTVFMNWNGGDVTVATSPADYNAESPETGTIFQISTTKPNTANDAFTYNTASRKGEFVAYKPDKINVWPNPYFGYNPEERTPVDQQMQFTHLPETGNCTIRIFDLAGTPVRRIEHNDAGSQFEVWDLRNNYGIPVASGMYIAHIETDAGEQVLKLAVVMPEQRLDVY